MPRIYLVEGPNDSKALVDTNSGPQALAYAARVHYKARLPTSHELAALIASGVKVEVPPKPEAAPATTTNIA